MLFRNLKNNFNSKFTKYCIILFLISLLITFLSIKNEFIFNTINYIQDYLNYYIDKYLNGVVSNLAFYNQSLIYIENDVKNVASSLFLYVVTYGSKLYFIFVLIMLLIIFNQVSNKYYQEIYQNGIVNKITRIKLKKYINLNIITDSIYYGLIFIIPKILYLIMLSIFFPIGVSRTHFISNASYLSQSFLYNAYSLSPYIMILLDLLLTFLFGIVIYYISLIIVSIIKNKLLSYFGFIVSLCVISIITFILPAFIFHKVPFIFYNSIFVYFSQILKYDVSIKSIYIPVYTMAIFSILMGVLAKIIYSKGIRDNI